MNEKILLMEDEEASGMILTERLRSEGYAVEVASVGENAFDRALARSCDLIILDARRSGFRRGEVCREIREAGFTNPVLLLIAHDQSAHTVLGFKLGADDCVTEPIEMAEVLARVEALLRRRHLQARAGIHHFGSVRIDIPGRTVTRNGKLVFLHLREFELLRYLVEHAGIPLARDELLHEVWGYEAGTFTRTVDAHVAGLRRKLEENPKRPKLILTVAGIGYQFGR